MNKYLNIINKAEEVPVNWDQVNSDQVNSDHFRSKLGPILKKTRTTYIYIGFFKHIPLIPIFLSLLIKLL